MNILLCIRDADDLAGEQIDASMFVPVDIGVEITKIKEERRPFTILHEG
jgi:hypothetical protein